MTIRFGRGRFSKASDTAAALTYVVAVTGNPSLPSLNNGSSNLYVPEEHIYIPRCVMCRATPQGGENITDITVHLTPLDDTALNAQNVMIAYAPAGAANVPVVAYMDLEMPVGRDVGLVAFIRKNAGVQPVNVLFTAFGLIQPRGQLQLS